MPSRMEEMASKGMGKAKATKARLTGLKGIFKKLSEEHGEVSALLKRVSKSSDPSVRAELFPKIRAELLSHERGELTELYPLLREHSATQAIARDHDREANELEALLEQLEDTPYDDEDWGVLFHDLVELVEHHVSEEENEYFPKAQEVLGAETARELEKRYLTAKQTAMRALG